MITWPCILKLDGDDELIYLPSKSDFISECQQLILTDTDNVIDAVGVRYVIEEKGKTLVLRKSGEVFSVEQITYLIQAHEFKKLTVCLTKIHFDTISNAINSLAQ